MNVQLDVPALEGAPAPLDVAAGFTVRAPSPHHDAGQDERAHVRWQKQDQVGQDVAAHWSGHDEERASDAELGWRDHKDPTPAPAAEVSTADDRPDAMAGAGGGLVEQRHGYDDSNAGSAPLKEQKSNVEDSGSRLVRAPRGEHDSLEMKSAEYGRWPLHELHHAQMRADRVRTTSLHGSDRAADSPEVILQRLEPVAVLHEPQPVRAACFNPAGDLLALNEFQGTAHRLCG